MTRTENLAAALSHHTEALRRLWSHAARDVLITHPDPLTRVDVLVTVQNAFVQIRMPMYNLRDTRNRDVILYEDTQYSDNAFAMKLMVTDWVGIDNARHCIAAAWALYGVHETLELTHYLDHRGKESRIMDPHENGAGDGQDLIQTCVNGRGTVFELAQVLGFVLGKDKAADRLSKSARAALVELDTETAFVRDGGDWQ